MIKFKIQEGLNLPKKAKFDVLVEKWKPIYHQVTTYGYDWEFPIEAYDDLINSGFNWAVKERVTNKEHPDYGKRYVSINMYHGRDSGLRHLVQEGLNFSPKPKFNPGDKVKLKPTAPQWELFNYSHCSAVPQWELFRFNKNLIFIVLEYTEDNQINILPESHHNNIDFNWMLTVYPEQLELIQRGDYIQEHWKKLLKISEGLNLPKQKLYYSLADDQNNGQLMWSGLNSTSLDELKDGLLSYISIDYSTEPYDGWENEEEGERGYKDWLEIQKLTVFQLADMWEFGIIEHTKPFKDDGFNIDDESGGISKRLTEGLNFPKLHQLNPERWVKGFMGELKPYRSRAFNDTIYYRKDGKVYMEYYIPKQELMYHLQTFTRRLEDMGFEYDNVAPFMKKMFEEVFGLPVTKSRNDTIATSIWWEGIKDWYPYTESIAEGLNLPKKPKLQLSYAMIRPMLIQWLMNEYAEDAAINQIDNARIDINNDIVTIIYDNGVKDVVRISPGSETKVYQIAEGLNMSKKKRFKTLSDNVLISLYGKFEEILDMREMPEITNNNEFLNWIKSEYQALINDVKQSDLIPILLSVSYADLIDVDNATVSGNFKFLINMNGTYGRTKESLIEDFMNEFNKSREKYPLEFKFDVNNIKFDPALKLG